MEENNIVLALELNKILQKEDTIIKISKVIQDKLRVKNVVAFYKLAKCYNLATISESSLLYIQRCFSMVIETQNFLHLDFSLVEKVLASSELNIHSEVEIFNAAITWLKFNIEERSKYAKQLLLKVRLPLLSEHALKYIIDKISSITDNCKSVIMLKEDLAAKNCFKNKSNIFYTKRYCNQSNFDLLICGNYVNRSNKTLSKIEQIDGSNMNKVKDLVSMNECRAYFEAVCFKRELYIFGGYDNSDKLIKLVEKYSPATNEWTVVTNMVDERKHFCTCAFMNEIFIVGGHWYDDDYEVIVTNSCLRFNTKDKSLKQVSRMNESRDLPASVVFQGNIVVSGGMDNNNNYLNTVESYDVFGDKWSRMPSMINNQINHSLVVIKDKLFVIGYRNNNCEVFDNVCKEFVALMPSYNLHLSRAMSIGNKIKIFQELRSSVVCYDVDKDEWFEESCDATNTLFCFSCAKMPQY